jgi:uncharacterized protein (DUF2267 family)
MCHELAHLSGYAREEEANFVSYLACMGSEDPFFRYSAAYTALRYVMNALSPLVAAEEYQALYAALPERVQADFQASRLYWDQFKGKMAAISETVNDAYLKLNAQPAGVRSYGLMVEFLFAYYREEG